MAGNAKPKYVGAPMWIVTFADLSTLMLTFFVLLLSFSHQDIIKFREMLGSVQGAFGVKIAREGEFQAALTGEGTTQVEKKKEEEEKKDKLKRQFVKVTSAIKKAVGEAKMGKNTEIILRPPDGALVRVKGEALFAPGSTRINPKSVKLLNGIAEILQKTKFFLTVEGHTDNVPPKISSKTMYKSNWELSGIRAAVVVRYLISRKAPPSRLSAAGYGAMTPIADNNTPEGRAKNRRVEFLIRKPKTG